MKHIEYNELLNMAISNLENAYAIYSKCKVSAALLCEDGTVVLGVNVENVSFGATICAERSAMVSAISNGKRKFKAIAIATSLENPIMPCGICRQFMLEFTSDIDIIIGNEKGYKLYKLGDIIPNSFNKQNLEIH